MDHNAEISLMKENVLGSWSRLSPETQSIVRAVSVLAVYYISIALVFIPFSSKWELNGNATADFVDAIYFGIAPL
eukprot:921362-Prorocentrum_minimum.AAC.1